MKKHRYIKSLLIYFVILVLLISGALVYTYYSLKSFETHQVNKYIMNYVKNIQDEELITFLENNKLDKNQLDGYRKIINDNDIKLIDNKDNSFELNLNNRKVFTINTEVTEEITTLGLFTYQKRNVVDVKPHLEKGLVYYDFILPDNWDIYLDGEKLDKKNVEETKSTMSDIYFMYDSIDMPRMSVVKVRGLDEEKDIVIKDFNGVVQDFKEENHVFYKDNYYEKIPYEKLDKTRLDNVDVMHYIRTWSLYLTGDLPGAQYGYYNMKELVAEGTYINNRVYNWAFHIDVTQLDSHSLANPPFTNEQIKNCTFYSNEHFMCEVHLEKHILIRGRKKIDIINDEVYFMKKYGKWYLVNVKPVSTNNEKGDNNEDN